VRPLTPRAEVNPRDVQRRYVGSPGQERSLVFLPCGSGKSRTRALSSRGFRPLEVSQGHPTSRRKSGGDFADAESHAHGARCGISVAGNVVSLCGRDRDGRGLWDAETGAAPVVDRGRQVRINHATLLASASSTMAAAGSSNSSPQSAQAPWRGSSSCGSMDWWRHTSSPSSLADDGGDVGFGSSMTL